MTSAGQRDRAIHWIYPSTCRQRAKWREAFGGGNGGIGGLGSGWISVAAPPHCCLTPCRACCFPWGFQDLCLQFSRCRSKYCSSIGQVWALLSIKRKSFLYLKETSILLLMSSGYSGGGAATLHQCQSGLGCEFLKTEYLRLVKYATIVTPGYWGYILWTLVGLISE